MPHDPAPSSSPPASAQAEAARPLDELAQELAALGAETDTERAVKRIVPWVISAGMHGAAVILGFLLTWTVVMLQREEPPAMIVADFEALSYEPLQLAAPDPQPQEEPVVPDPVLQQMARELPAETQETPLDPLGLLVEASRETVSLTFTPDRSRTTATFVGLSSSNARRIAYVIDASGSMIPSLPIVIDELARSLDGLDEDQRFAVIFFQRNEAVTVPPASRLTEATEAERARVLQWIRDRVIPAGRSNPIAAIRKALSLKPDVIFLLSQNITGSGEFEIDQRELLALLDTLNPFDPRLGRRGTQINCIQFVDPDPLGTLERIAEIHGGAGGYKFLDREELGLKAP